jgi:predicted enzyme related to lactoylglutathione lyase
LTGPDGDHYRRGDLSIKEAVMAKKGQNVWFDLMTSDVAAAKRFYSEVIGWKTEDWKDSDPKNPYTMWKIGERPIGGVMGTPAEAAGVPPHWMAHTKVDDVDATVAEAKKLGGSVHKPAWDIPNVGRLAILADPQGAAFSVYKPSEDTPTAPPSQAGEFSWAELNTTDYESAWKFYSQLFGWKATESMDMGEGMGMYFMFSDPDKVTKGGMSNMAKTMNAPAHWLHYVTVDDINGAVERVKSKGGKVLNGPMDVPGGDVIAQCQDPQGGFFALHARKN